MKKTAKILILAVLCFTIGASVCGCSSSQWTTAIVKANAFEGTRSEVRLGDEIKTSLEGFSAKFTSGVIGLSDGRNVAVSPVSLYSALAMAVACTQGNTSEQILGALDIDEATLFSSVFKLNESLNRSFYCTGATGSEKLNGRVLLTNSVWLDKSLNYKSECVDLLSSVFNASTLQTDFGNDNAKSNRLVREFVKDKTNGLINNDFDFNDLTNFILLNTLYVKDVWNLLGDDCRTTKSPYDFTETSGAVKSRKLLESDYFPGKKHIGKGFTSFSCHTYYNCEITFLLPDDGESVKTVMTDENVLDALTAKYVTSDEESKTLYFTRCLFPEFVASYNNGVADLLKEKFGITDLFEQKKCDLSALTDDRNAYCRDVRHVTQLEVNKKGIEGAAVTAIYGNTSTANREQEYAKVYEDFIVNKAFGFLIADGNGTVLFSGAVNTIK